MAKRMCRVAFVALAALCLASIASACAVRVPASEFPAMMLVQPDDSGGANLKYAVVTDRRLGRLCG